MSVPCDQMNPPEQGVSLWVIALLSATFQQPAGSKLLRRTAAAQATHSLVRPVTPRCYPSQDVHKDRAFYFQIPELGTGPRALTLEPSFVLSCSSH